MFIRLFRKMFSIKQLKPSGVNGYQQDNPDEPKFGCGQISVYESQTRRIVIQCGDSYIAMDAKTAHIIGKELQRLAIDVNAQSMIG
jgi:hypothetical protein